MSKDNLYLDLFHGRKTRDEELDDWGQEGPIIGPIGFGWTYGLPKIWNDTGMEHLHIVDDMIYFDRMFYGDFSVYAIGDTELAKIAAERIVLTFEQAEKIIRDQNDHAVRMTTNKSILV